MRTVRSEDIPGFRFVYQDDCGCISLACCSHAKHVSRQADESRASPPRRFAALSTLILVPTDVATALEEQRPPWLSLWWRIAYWCACCAAEPEPAAQGTTRLAARQQEPLQLRLGQREACSGASSMICLLSHACWRLLPSHSVLTGRAG